MESITIRITGTQHVAMIMALTSHIKQLEALCSGLQSPEALKVFQRELAEVRDARRALLPGV